MAYERRTWYQRLGQGLNKFLIGEKDAEGKQELTNAPDSVTQQGDVISADNLNDLEGRIQAGFNGVSGVLVWENASPKTAFANQNLTLNNIPSASNHVFAIDYVKMITDTDYFDSSIATKRVFFNGDSSAPTKYSNTYILEESEGAGVDFLRGVRFAVSTGSIVLMFDKGQKVTNGVFADDNTVIVPLRVYLFS